MEIDADITIKKEDVIVSTVDTNTSGTYEIIYETKDSSDNIGRLILSFMIKD